MTIQDKFLLLAVMTAFFVSCKSSKQASSSGELDGMQHVTLDTMMVEADGNEDENENLPPYKPSEERIWDLIHTSLDLSFDWKNESVIGTAVLTLTPVFYTQTSLRLDAINFDIRRLTVDGDVVTNFQNSGEEIIIPLAHAFKKEQRLKVEIAYSAHPSESGESSSAAITSDKGLFFIDPQDTIPGLPMQIWTQGETTNNSRWFPTLDQPNERGTQEIVLTVSDTMMTLSNGLLISSTPAPGNMRRDHWKLDLPHAPYLAMIAVGKWDKVSDYWRGRPIDYYVDPGYGPSAREIFANTPEMIEFFSKILGYEFVWHKYSQIIVKDFVSGAMENTTAVVFGDFIQFHKEDVIEQGVNDYIVAHELFHHWFGDLVTCESWANLTLNEGFANYAEYLWQEYKYDRERADISRLSELSGYFDQAAYDAHSLIRYHYDDEGDMFDAHSYNKGGLVLHMLRDLVGDEAFFASLQSYLKEHAFKAAEVDDLRQSFEDVTGRDLQWFFDQWYLSKGHPVIDISHTYDVVQRKLNVEFTQTQVDDGFREVFVLPMEIAIFQQDSSVVVHQIRMDQKSQTFSFEMPSAPMAVVIDPRDILLAVVHHEIAPSEYPIRAISNLSINHRLSAFRMMQEIDPLVINKLLMDSSYTMRAMVISYLHQQGDAEKLYQLSLQENDPEIQYFIFESLRETDPMKAKEIAIDLLETSGKTPVIYSALKALAAVDIDEAVHWVTHFKDNPSPAIYTAKAAIYAEKGNIVNLDFFTTAKAAQIDEDYLEEFIGAMALFMSKETSAIQDKGLGIVDSDFFLKTANPEFRRFYLITGLLKQYAEETNTNYKDKLLTTINSLYNKETNEYLRGVLKEGLGDLLD
jgi:aminopeptidase N